MIHIQTFTWNPFQVNTYVLYEKKSGKAYIIDPSCYTREEQLQLDRFIKEKGLHPEKILNTHCHIDHVLGNQYVKNQYQVNIHAHKEETFMIDNAVEMGMMFGLQIDPLPHIDHYIGEEKKLRLGDELISIFHVPGHSSGSLAFYAEDSQFVITGDALFQGGIGRTDLPGGNYDTLIKNIQDKLFSLPGDTKVLPGHGPSSSIASERDNNPFF